MTPQDGAKREMEGETMTDRKISVVTCLWNNMRYWKTFYTSLKARSMKIDELIVVDNGLTDDTSRIPEECPDVRFIRLPENRFEGGGVAVAMKEATGDLVFKCDPDIEFLSARWMEDMIEELDRTELVGAVVNEPYFWPRLEHRSYTEASVLIGTLFLLERRVMDRCGVWDPGLKYGTNEFDYGIRMRRAGFTIAITDKIPIIHFNHHIRMRAMKAFDVGPLIEESWKALHAKMGTKDYWELKENIRFKGNWDEQSKPPTED